MTKKLFIITLLFLIFSFGLYKVADNLDTFFPDPVIEVATSTGVIIEPEPSLTEKEINKQIVTDKILKLKARYAQSGLIIAGDDHLQNNEYLEALKIYNEVLHNSPNDEKIIKKIADTYFGMKKYEFAYNKYLTISDYQNLDKHNIWLSLIYSNQYNQSNRAYIKNEIKEIGFESDNEFYYDNMLNCLDDFHECKKLYQNYLSSSSGAVSDKLLSISGAIAQYQDFQIEELYFKDTLIIKTFYDDKNYPIVIQLGKNILLEQPDYRPVMKMIAQSYFELGKYDESKQYLVDLYELDKSDPDIAYMLGVINRELGEFVLSNILLNQAIKNNYTPSVFPYRFLINNYLDLDRPKQALQTFDELLLDTSGAITKDDLLLASYYNIIYENLPKAESIIESAIKSFPEYADFYGFGGWIYKEKLDFVSALENLKKGNQIDPKNAMITLNIAQVYILEKEEKQAVIYLKQTVKNDPEGQFGSVAQELLDEL